MRINNKTIGGFALVLFGATKMLQYFGVINFTNENILATTLIFYGLPSVYFSLNDGKRARLFFASVIFLTGIIFFIKANYELIDPRGLVFTSILFISGAAFIILFIENTTQKIFLYTGLFLMLTSYFSITFFKELGIIDTANKLVNKTEIFWPVVLILTGLSIFLNRKR